MRFTGFLFFIIALILLTSKTSFSQDQSSDFKKYQIDITVLGPSKIKTFYDASTSGLGFVYKHNYWAVNGQILYTKKIMGSSAMSNGSICTDLLGGLRYEFKKIELSCFTGIGLNYHRAADSQIDSDLGNADQNIVSISLPIKCKFDYLIGKRITIGLLGYYNANNVNSIYALSLNLGYRF